jgi:Sporulation and spore germination
MMAASRAASVIAAARLTRRSSFSEGATSATSSSSERKRRPLVRTSCKVFSVGLATKRRRARSNARRSFAMVFFSHFTPSGRPLRGGVRRKYFRRPSRRKLPDVRSPRLLVLVALLAIVAAGTWYYLSHGVSRAPETLAVYYTKLDGTSLAEMRVSLRPRQPDESGAEHLHNTVLYAAVQAVAGPPNDVQAIRFPPGTRILSVSVDGSTATVDLSKEVERQAGGSFGENGEFKALVYTITGISGIDAVQILVEGDRLETLPGGHLELDQPLHRADW